VFDASITERSTHSQHAVHPGNADAVDYLTTESSNAFLLNWVGGFMVNCDLFCHTSSDEYSTAVTYISYSELQTSKNGRKTGGPIMEFQPLSYLEEFLVCRSI
jgi:hypothetical protein